MTDTLDPSRWVCPSPLRDHGTVMLGHGGGGILSGELVEHLFLPAFDPARFAASPVSSPVAASTLADSAVLEIGGTRLAFSTDSYVVRPLFFPGGSIGELAVHGTINDLACSGATPIALSVGFILEEGLDLEVLGRVAQAMGRAAARAGVRLVTGDTKVVERGLADGLYINTSGIGVVPPGIDIRPELARPGDRVLVSGPVGAHGVAVLSVRENLEFGGDVRSDTAALHRLVAALLAAVPGAVHTLRDPTRGGLATSLCEIAVASGVGVELTENAVPIPPVVEAACAFLGLDPLHVANEGRVVAFVAPDRADAALAEMRAHPDGRDAAIIGTVTDDHPGMVVGRTAFGTTRIIDRPLGEQLPRIC